ncbi:hypothetical protein HMPREF0519_1961 [Lentilactobacillus hilgardii DSM 20176 = ATCC 8290]|uniref:Uncharacterized protein n=1 Tax=Lentilactobacillus hilgardii (strain ATCC 8290 / DSM 20176 / CCUG 30140 / JCM 1155 / KCTC 3500 / NBRC 15886 / NCIMB 8040 / NRRL B-1843 / 9) TaxID=1423757 RepID=C0XL50_LENH9|nr:hypothetical protein HMPREF0519_1961 [Lentilactobacillus hilgardii DSM 20176 = ATCC 8290]
MSFLLSLNSLKRQNAKTPILFDRWAFLSLLSLFKQGFFGT